MVALGVTLTSKPALPVMLILRADRYTYRYEVNLKERAMEEGGAR